MAKGLSEKVRMMAQWKYVDPALRSGKSRFEIRVRDLISELRTEGVPPRYTPQICSALQAGKFLQQNGLEIESIDGPPSKQSPTVVIHYRIAKPHTSNEGVSASPKATDEDDRIGAALRAADRLRGLLKEEIAQFGGGEAFLRWVRSEDEDAA
jgi:hypothetical protein